MFTIFHSLRGAAAVAILLSLAAIGFVGCGESENNYKAPIVWQDYACNQDDDCVIMDVPGCCGTSEELYTECVNKDYKPPAEINCSDGSHACLDMIMPVSCVCEASTGDNPDIPERMCSGVPSSELDGGQ